jgi:hypothetical protein
MGCSYPAQGGKNIRNNLKDRRSFAFFGSTGFVSLGLSKKAFLKK